MGEVDFLRKKYPKFVYENYSHKILGKDLKISFDFKIEPNIEFHPKVIIKNVDKNQIKTVGEGMLNNLIFNLGLMEIPSYWKATCSKEIIVKTGYLNEEQIKWWKDLIIDGMGQFFYENKIDFRKPDFLTIKSYYSGKGIGIKRNSNLTNRILVPIGGGKDSIVTLELLKQAKKDIQCFSLNPTGAAQKIMKIAGFNNPIIVKRTIDPKLLELNRRGFLNGHTPFSAYLAFLSVLVASIFDYKYIALSNERSSNEGNVKYLGKIINHQWSKSFEFEKKFREYSQKYLTSAVKEDKSSFPPSLSRAIAKGEEESLLSSPSLRRSSVIEYFSFLRPLYEIQIAKLFSKYPKYFSAFLSCNEAYKTDSGRKKPLKKWCCKCSKCLFAFVVLYPFLKEKELIKIFGKNLFNDKNLLPIMEELIGERKFKPFECVGTIKESLTAFYLALRSFTRRRVKDRAKLPILLKYFKEKILPKYPNLENESKEILNSWNNQNYLPKEFEKILRGLT